MATFFGEILPGSSRAVADFEDEEDEIIHRECNVNWTEKIQGEVNSSLSKKLVCDILIVATGPAASAFVETSMLDDESELLATISEEGDETQDREHHRPTLHRLHKHPTVVVYKGQVDPLPEQSYGVINRILEYIPQKATVIVLCTQPLVNYKGRALTGAIRALKTTAYSHPLPCTYIETPNIVDGLPAQVLTTCQIMGRPAVLYVVYMENIYFDNSYIAAFTEILQVPPLQAFAQDMVVSSKTIEKKADRFAQSHNFFT